MGIVNVSGFQWLKRLRWGLRRVSLARVFLEVWTERDYVTSGRQVVSFATGLVQAKHSFKLQMDESRMQIFSHEEKPMHVKIVPKNYFTGNAIVYASCLRKCSQTHLIPKILNPEKLLELFGFGWAAGAEMDRSEHDDDSESTSPGSSSFSRVSRDPEISSISPSDCQSDDSISDVLPGFSSRNFKNPVRQGFHSWVSNRVTECVKENRNPIWEVQETNATVFSLE